MNPHPSLEQGHVRGAIQMYEKAFALDPNNRATHYFLGELYIQDMQFDAGIQHLQELFSSDLEYTPAEAALGLAFYLQSDQVKQPTERALLYVQAEERLLQALQTDPKTLALRGTSVRALLESDGNERDYVNEPIQTVRRLSDCRSDIHRSHVGACSIR
jgi:tetratricopeptide (TPR) repeat protein